MSSARAPDRWTARPARTSPTTVILIRISSRRVVSPPASAHWNLPEARRKPPRNRSSHWPVCVSGKARLSRKQRGAPPIAATSLTALARHFQPTASGGCFSRKKCVPSRNQSQVRTISCPGFGRESAASSPIPRATDCPAPWPCDDREVSAIFRRIESSFWSFRGIGSCRDANLIAGDSIVPDGTPVFCNTSGPTMRSPCTFGQGTGLHSLTFEALNTGLTYDSTEFSMSEVADQGSRFRFLFKFRFQRAVGVLPANVKFEGLRGPCSHEGQELHILHRVDSGQAPESHRTGLCAAWYRGIGAHRQHYGDGSGGLLFANALEGRQLQRASSRSRNPEEAVSATPEHGHQHQPAPGFSAVPGDGSGHDLRGAPLSSGGIRSERQSG